MQLPGPLAELLRDALLDAFKQQSDLEELVRYRLDTDPGDIFANGETRKDAVVRLINWSAERDCVGKLLVAAREKRSSNLALKAATEEITPLLPPGSLTIDTAPLLEGVKALGRLMDNAAVRAAVEHARQDITQTGDRLMLVSAYKTVHDILHNLQLQCYDPLVAELAKFPDDDIARDNVESHLFNYRIYLTKLRNEVAANIIPSGEMKWVHEFLDSVETNWSEGLQQRSKELVRKAEQLLKRVLAFYPSKINTALDRAVQLMLPTFVDTLRQIAADLPEHNNEDQLRFKAGLDRLESMTTALVRLVDAHNRWQEIENELRNISEFVQLSADPVAYIVISWPTLRDSLLAPTLTDRRDPSGAFLYKLCEKLEEAIGKQDQTQTKDRFWKLRTQGKDLFYDVDKRLKSQCDELPSVAGQLQPLLSLL